MTLFDGLLYRRIQTHSSNLKNSLGLPLCSQTFHGNQGSVLLMALLFSQNAI